MFVLFYIGNTFSDLLYIVQMNLPHLDQYLGNSVVHLHNGQWFNNENEKRFSIFPWCKLAKFGKFNLKGID